MQLIDLLHGSDPGSPGGGDGRMLGRCAPGNQVLLSFSVRPLTSSPSGKGGT